MDNNTNFESNKEALEHLAHIKTITKVEKDRYGKKTGPYFIIWGLIWLIGFTMTATNLQEFIFWVWLGLSIVGWTFTIILWFRQEHDTPIPSFLQTQLSYVWGSFAIIIVIFIFLMSTKLLAFSGTYLLLYMVLLAVIMYALLSIVLGKELLFMAIWLGLLAAISFTWFQSYMNLIYAVIGGGSLIITGLLLLRQVNNDE